MGQALEAAARRCEAAGERWTPPRRRTYQLLVEAAGPMKAYDIIAAFEPSKGTKPPTVYRALEFLRIHGLVHRIETLNAYLACTAGGPHQAVEFLVCDRCHATVETDCPALPSAEAVATMRDFQLRDATVEVRGLCPECRQAQLSSW